jgi:serine/threonine-protein kinase HipA
MAVCPITYKTIFKGKYSTEGLKKLSRYLTELEDFPYSAEEQRTEAIKRAAKLSIQGVQPKLSAILSPKDQGFVLADQGGTYILKPQSFMYAYLPENEDLTMRLAYSCGIETPLHGLIYAKDKSFTYFIKRFDRISRKKKVPIEDFAQLAGESRDTKYRYSVEKVIMLIDKYCTFPMIEKVGFFKRILFNFIVGNEDMHLKNYSVITKEGITKLAPAYDFLNTTLAIPNSKEESALPINGRKSNFTKKDFLDYLAKDRLSLTDKSIEIVLQDLKIASQTWHELVKKSFLPDKLKDAYWLLIRSRLERVF